jgi:Sulfotransferase domain
MDRKVNLFIVGVAKSGTSSLYDYLCQHKDIFMLSIKEPHFFSDLTSPYPYDYYSHKNQVDYAIIKEQKIYETLYKNAKFEKYIVEASTSYFRDQNTPQNLINYNKDSKIIIILRNPVERIASHYFMLKNVGIETSKNIIEAINIDNNKIKNNSNAYDCHYYLKHSDYLVQVNNYKKYFKDDQILVLDFKELKNNPKLIMDKCTAFLGLENEKKSYNFEKQNEGNKKPLSFIIPKIHLLLKRGPLSLIYKKILTQKIRVLLKKIFYVQAEMKLTNVEENYLNEICKDNLNFYNNYFEK